jgi:hypothetical protein
LYDLGEIEQASGEAIHLINNDGVDFAGIDICKQAFETRAFEGSSGESSIVVPGGQDPPTLMMLAVDVGFAGFALGVQGVEGLFQTLL